jgi:hypothetical protein
VVAIWLERLRHRERHREIREREGQTHTHTVFFFSGWVGVCVVRGPTTEREFVWGARKHEWVEVVKSGFSRNNWVTRVYRREQEEEQEDGDFVMLLLSACMMGRQFLG